MPANGLAEDLELPKLDPLFSDETSTLEALRDTALARVLCIKDPNSAYAQSLVDVADTYDKILRGTMPPGELEAGAFAELERSISSYAKRRNQELAVADYLEATIANAEKGTGDYTFTRLADSMRRCHYVAPVSFCEETEEVRCQWDHKCHQSKLCPHEARAAANEFIELYTPLILHLLAKVKSARVQYWVISPPHVQPGELEEQKKTLYGWLQRKLARLRREKVICGAFVTQEDPVAIGGELFNVHFNLLVVTRGRPSFDYLRNDVFKCMTHFEDERGMVKRTAQAKRRRGVSPEGFTKTELLRSALTEIVKYSAKLVGASDKHTPHSVKTKGPQAEQAAGAPPLVEWSPEMFRCWWDANRGFNRVRSYGLFNAQTKIRTDSARDNPDPVELRQAARAFGTPPLASIAVLGLRLRKVLEELGWSDMQLAQALDAVLDRGMFRCYTRLLEWLPPKKATWPDGTPKAAERRQKPRLTPPTPPTALERRVLATVLKKTELALFHLRGVCVRDLLDPPAEPTPLEDFIRVGHVEWNQRLRKYRPLILIKAAKSHQNSSAGSAQLEAFDARAGPDPPLSVYAGDA